MLGEILLGTLIVAVVIFVFWNKRATDLFNYKNKIFDDCIKWDVDNADKFKSTDGSAFTWCFEKLPNNKAVLFSFTPINNGSMLSEQMTRKFGYDLSDEIKTILELEKEKEQAVKIDDFERAKELFDEINKRKYEKKYRTST
jgi:hypothetical protein|tara:strand:+ start:17932 stop:18357 length:426 start_codon:yes stop_codon:yes gene_type:complete